MASRASSYMVPDNRLTPPRRAKRLQKHVNDESHGQECRIAIDRMSPFAIFEAHMSVHLRSISRCNRAGHGHSLIPRIESRIIFLSKNNEQLVLGPGG